MNNEVLVNYYEIDGKNYLIMSELIYNGKNYCYLINESDNSDHFVRRLDKDILYPLENKNELADVLELFTKKLS